MITEVKNPFNVTKAVDFSDAEIIDYWVDISDESSDSGFHSLMKPNSPMPMFVLGSKGSGKTHLMRYFSFACQTLRNPDNPKKGITEEGYLGVYLRCSGLNASRYKGKDKSEEFWNDVFAYSFDLWLAQILLDNIIRSDLIEDKLDHIITQEICKLFDDETYSSSLKEVSEHIISLQHKLDRAVNNILFTEKFDASIILSRGTLVYGIPQIIRQHVASLNDFIVVYLIDEFENLSENQQKYINTLVRERQEGSTFKVGAKLYGVKTYKTYSDEEEIKEGSEYEKLAVDAQLRKDEEIYSNFAFKLIASRLMQTQTVDFINLDNPDHGKKELSGFFQDFDLASLLKQVSDKFSSQKTPWLKSLEEHLHSAIKRGFFKRSYTKDDVKLISSNLACVDDPLLEKFNTFQLYKSWAKPSSLIDSSAIIKKECQSYLAGFKKSSYSTNYNHYKSDMLAQVLKSSGLPQRHTGYDFFVKLSWGVPRNLFIILKNIYSWSDYKSEKPFNAGAISQEAQTLGVSDSADWFFEDARSFGNKGHRIQVGLNRLATLLRTIRFSDKPSECSPSSFACDFSSLPKESIELIREAEKWSLLVSVDKRKAKNSAKMLDLFQINRMLAPKWDLPIARRGVLELSTKEVNAIFIADDASLFDEILKIRKNKMMAPNFGITKTQFEQRSFDNL